MTAAPSESTTFEVVQDDYAPLPEWFRKTGAGQWTAIPHAVWEKLGRAFSLITIRVYCAIAKETWGTSVRQRGADGKLVRDADGKVLVTRREWCEEPQDEISRRLGVGKSTVAEAIAQLTRYKLTIRQADPKDRRRARYKNDLYALLSFDADSVVDDEDGEAEVKAPAPAQAAAPLRNVQPHEPLILLPGERNRPFVLGDQRGRISNATAAQVAVKVSMLDDGELDFAICDLPDEKQASEKKANPIGGQQVREKIHPENRMYFAPESPPAVSTGSGSARGETSAEREGARPWIDVSRDPDLARFTAVISTLGVRLHSPPPAEGWRRQQFSRLKNAGVPIEAFEARFKLRGAALTSYGGIIKLVDDVIAAHSPPPDANGQHSKDAKLAKEYELYRAQAAEMAIEPEQVMTYEEYRNARRI